jgi:outer membrane protein
MTPTPAAAVTTALAQRADVRAADFNVRAATAGVASARSGVLPAVTLSAGYARGVDSGFAANGPTVSALVSIPLGGGVAARVHAQAALLEAARARRTSILRSVALEVGAAARTAAATLQAEAAASAGLGAAQAELDASTLGYARGASTSLELTLARSTYTQAAVDALAARYDRLQAQAILALEIGA